MHAFEDSTLFFSPSRLKVMPVVRLPAAYVGFRYLLGHTHETFHDFTP